MLTCTREPPSPFTYSLFIASIASSKQHASSPSSPSSYAPHQRTGYFPYCPFRKSASQTSSGAASCTHVCFNNISPHPQLSYHHPPLSHHEGINWLEVGKLNLLLLFLQLLLIQAIQRLQREFEIRDKCVTAGFCKVFAHNDAQHLHLFRVGSHGVGGDDPAAFAELVGTAMITSASVWLVIIERKGGTPTQQIHHTSCPNPHRFGPPRAVIPLRLSGS
jgi:hypothetical protein